MDDTQHATVDLGLAIWLSGVQLASHVMSWVFSKHMTETNKNIHIRTCRLILPSEMLQCSTECSGLTPRNPTYTSESHHLIPYVMSMTRSRNEEEETIYVQTHFSERACRVYRGPKRVCRIHWRTSIKDIASSLIQCCAYSCSLPQNFLSGLCGNWPTYWNDEGWLMGLVWKGKSHSNRVWSEKRRKLSLWYPDMLIPNWNPC